MGSFRTLQVPLTMGDVLQSINLEFVPLNTRPAEIQTDEGTIPGECGGSATYVIRVDDITGDFSGSFTFSDFCEDGVVIDGNASFSGLFDWDTEDFDTAKLTFDLLYRIADHLCHRDISQG